MTDIIKTAFDLLGTQGAPSEKRQELLDFFDFYNQACYVAGEIDFIKKLFTDYPKLLSFTLSVQENIDYGQNDVSYQVQKFTSDALSDLQIKEIKKNFRSGLFRYINTDIILDVGDLLVSRDTVNDLYKTFMTQEQHNAFFAVEHYEKNLINTHLDSVNHQAKINKL